MDSNYTLENAKQFGWSSISGDLDAERVAHLQTYLVGHKILDAGCGGGGYVDFLTAQNYDVTGVDKFAQFLDVARQQERKGHFVQGDLTALDFADKSFDCTFCFDVLEHIDDVAAVKELARVTQKRLILAVPKADELMSQYNLTFAHHRDKTHLREYKEATLRDIVDSISHTNLKIFPELPINSIGVVLELLDFDSMGGSLRDETAKRYMSHLLYTAKYKKVYTGLVAIVDLD